jgi:Cdc6-like AAA superfamily ATPase
MLRDPSVFDESHIPRRLVARESEVDRLLRELRPAIRDQRAEDVLISGPSGVGKTVLAKFCVGEVRTQTDLPTAHVRCLGQTRGAILRETLQQLDADVSRNTPTDDLPALLEEAVDKPTVVVLDEGDDVPQTGVLADLDETQLLSTIAICHDAEDWLVSYSGDRIGGWTETYEHIQLSRYRTPELADILERRARAGLVDGSIYRRGLEETANAAAGVARRGIQTLRAAAELGADRGHDRIRSADIQDGHELARKRIRQANLRSLPFHHHVLYELIRQHGQLASSELNRQYDTVAPDVYLDRDQVPISKRSRRNKLDKLRDYDLVESSEDEDPVHEAADSTIVSELELEFEGFADVEV